MNLLCEETASSLSVFSSHPLFSCIITLSTLILLYLPHLFWKLVFSPVLILTGILLLSIIRLGVIQRSQNAQTGIPGLSEDSEPVVSQENRGIKEEKEENTVEPEETNSLEKVHQWITSHSEEEFDSQMGFHSGTFFVEYFVEWNVKAPLEVIYEEYEGEEAEADPKENDTPQMGLSRYPSLSRYYPESESESDSTSDAGFPPIENWESPENICLRWDEEDREGLIEIALDDGKKGGFEFHFEEENLIEIDISPTKHNGFSDENHMFSGEISGN